MFLLQDFSICRNILLASANDSALPIKPWFPANCAPNAPPSAWMAECICPGLVRLCVCSIRNLQGL